MSWHNARGELLAPWPEKVRLFSLLRAEGWPAELHALSVKLTRYGIRLGVEEYGGDLGPPQLLADSEDRQALERLIGEFSERLRVAGVRHRFAIFDADGDDAEQTFEHLG